MSKVAAIAWREFKYTALTKAFIIGTIIFPLIIWGGIGAGQFLFSVTMPPLTGTLAVIDETGEMIEHVEFEFQLERDRGEQTTAEDVVQVLADPEGAIEAGVLETAARIDVEIRPYWDGDELDRLIESAREGDLLGVAVFHPATSKGEGGLTLYLPTEAHRSHVASIRRLLGSAVVRARAARDLPEVEVEDLRSLLRTPGIDMRRLTPEGEAAGGHEIQAILPIAFMILLWIASFASGNYLLTTTIEEKSNKVMEVLLSAVSPWQLMCGKILGQGIVGLATIAVYGGLGFAALSYFALADLITFSQIAYLAVYFLMAYFMIAAMMAAVGSAVSDLQEAHALITPVMLVLFLPMLLFVPVSNDPNGTLAVVTSFIPILTPFVMIIRVTATEPVEMWQIAASMVVGTLGVIVMVWLAARIFRVGVLMSGKPPSPLELLRWLRYS